MLAEHCGHRGGEFGGRSIRGGEPRGCTRQQGRDGRRRGKRLPGRNPQRCGSEMQRHERQRSAIALTEQSAGPARSYGRKSGASLTSTGCRYRDQVCRFFRDAVNARVFLLSASRRDVPERAQRAFAPVLAGYQPGAGKCDNRMSCRALRREGVAARAPAGCDRRSGGKPDEIRHLRPYGR
jgi:hypothetical protein